MASCILRCTGDKKKMYRRYSLDVILLVGRLAVDVVGDGPDLPLLHPERPGPTERSATGLLAKQRATRGMRRRDEIWRLLVEEEGEGREAEDDETWPSPSRPGTSQPPHRLTGSLGSGYRRAPLRRHPATRRAQTQGRAVQIRPHNWGAAALGLAPTGRGGLRARTLRPAMTARVDEKEMQRVH